MTNTSAANEVNTYPVLPLRDIVVFPHMIVPLFVGREKSIRALEEVMGSDKRNLIYQFLAESLVAIVAAMALGLVFCILALPFFNEFSMKSLEVSGLFSPFYLISLGVLLGLVTLLAGGYPAFFLSGFKPIDSLNKRVVYTSLCTVTGIS